MLKLLNLLLYGYASCIFGQNCILQQDINNNQYTTYQNKVYDISKYQHPGGQTLLFKAKGKTLEEFFYKDQYKFHIKDAQTIKDLESIYIGDVCKNNVINYKDVLYFKWDIDGDKLSIKATTKTIFNDQWFSIAFPIKDKQMAYSDAIIGWKYNNTLNIEAFMLAPQLKTNPYLIFNYKKPSYYLVDKNVYVDNNFTISFTKIFDNKQTYIKPINVIYAIGNKFSNEIIDNHILFGDFYIDLYNNLSNSNKNVEVDLDIVNYYFLIITIFIYFILFIFIFIITNSHYITYFLYIIDLQYLGFYTYGSIIFLTIYTLWWISILIYSFYGINNNDNLYRMGVWICLNISTTLLPITRNSIWIVFFKLSYEKIIFIHIYTGILCVVSIIIKLVASVVYYNFEFLFLLTKGTKGSPIAGTIASIAIILMALTSTSYIRKNKFEIFYYTHRILCIISIIGSVLHYLTCIYYFIPPLLLYIIDIILRYVHTHKAIYSKIKIIGNKKYGKSVVLTITMLDCNNIKPGSYFFIKCNKISRIEWHPITLVYEYNNNLVFCIKDVGDNTWSHNLQKFENKNISDNNNVFLQGPYGHFLLDYKKDNYKSVICVAGGIGITPFISILNHVSELYFLRKMKNLKKVYLIWIIPHVSLLNEFNERLILLNNKIINTTIFITNKNNNADLENSYFNIKYERPILSEYIKKVVYHSKISPKNTCVTCCSSTNISQELYSICNKLNINMYNENYN